MQKAKRTMSAKSTRKVPLLQTSPFKTQERDREIVSVYSVQQTRPMMTWTEPKQSHPEKIGSSLNRLLDIKLHTLPTKEHGDSVAQHKLMKLRLKDLEQQLAEQNKKNARLKSKSKQRNAENANEFEKELYWRGGAQHLVQGIKSEYERIKDLYEEKCEQCNQLRRLVAASKIQQIKAYNQSLLEHNQELLTELRSFHQEKMGNEPLSAFLGRRPEQENSYKQSQKQKQQALIIGELESQLRSKETKVQFLERLIIEKGNNEHAAYRKLNKNLQRIQSLQGQLGALNNQVQTVLRQKQLLAKQIEDKWRERMEQSEKKQQDKIQLKNQLIAKLERDIQQYAELLRRSQTYINVSHKTGDSLNFQPEPFRKQSATQSKIIEMPEKNKKGENSSVQSASVRHDSNSIRRRKVNPTQIGQIKQILRCRLIKEHVTTQEFCARFKQAPPWVKDPSMIAMAEFLETLQKQSQLLRLKPDQFRLFSRYVIEVDSGSQQFVYEHPENSNVRSIVLSILRNLIGGPLTTELLDEVRKQAESFMSKYSQNMKSSIIKLSSDRAISAKKLRDIVISMEPKISAEVISWVQGLLVRHSIEQMDISEL